MDLENGDAPFTNAIPEPQLVQRISECLDRMCTGKLEDTVEHLPQLLQFSVHQRFVEALIPLLNASNIIKRIHVAIHLTRLKTEFPDRIPQQALKRCDEIFVESLNHESMFVKSLGCTLADHCEVPDEALPYLQRLLDSPDPYMRSVAAVTLSKTGKLGASVFDVLTQSLESTNSDIVGMAAAALLQHRVKVTEALLAVRTRFKELNPFILRNVLLAAYKLGTPAEVLFDCIAPLVMNTKQEVLTRFIAATALGSISQNTDRATRELTKALKSSEWMVMDGAIQGFVASNRIPQKSINLIATRLSDPDVQFRQVAAGGLEALLGRYDVESLVPLLIKRLQAETDQQTLAHITLVLAGHSTDGTIQTLIERVRHGDQHELWNAGQVLTNMKESSAEAVADAVAASKLDHEYAMLLNILYSMGRHAAPAIPKLMEILDGTFNAFLAYQILRTLESLGSAADKALPSIIRCLLRFDHVDIREQVKNILVLRSAVSLDILRDATGKASGTDRTKLQGMLNEFAPTASPGSTEFQSFHKVAMVKRFVAMGQVLSTDGAFSQRGLSEHLESKVMAGELPKLGFSVQSLVRALEAVQTHFGGKPIVDAGKDSLMTLTAHGGAVLERCRKALKNA